MKGLFFSVFVAGVLALNAYSQAPTARYGTDFQIWSDAQVIVPFADGKWSATFFVVGRFGNDVRKVVDDRGGVMMLRRLSSKVTVGGGYMYRTSNPTFTSRKYQSRFFGVAYVNQPLGHKVTFTSRLMGQYEDLYSRPNDVVFETRLGINREMSFARHRFEPFVSFEPVFDTKLGQIVVYREQAGISYPVSKQVSNEIYYLRQDVPGHGARPGTANAIGTSVKIKVR